MQVIEDAIEPINNNGEHAIIKNKKYAVNLGHKSINAPETEYLVVNDKCRCITFTVKFAHLGTALDFIIDNKADVQYRINKVSKYTCHLKFTGKVNEELKLKIKLNETAALNFILWDIKSWSANKDDENRWEKFHDKPIRRMLGMPMTRVKDENIRKHSHNQETES